MQVIHKASLSYLESTLTQALMRLDAAESASFKEGVRPLVSPLFTAEMRLLKAELSRVAQTAASSKFHYQSCLATRNEQVERLSHLVRDFWMVLRRRVRLERLNPASLLFYRLPERAPAYQDAGLWLQHAENLLTGEVLARAEGYPPMVYPDPIRIKAQLDLARAAVHELAQARAEFCLDAQDLRLIQVEARHKLRGLAYRLKEATRGLEAPTRRALIRHFGLNFRAVTEKDQALALHEQAEPSLAPLAPAALAPEPEPIRQSGELDPSAEEASKSSRPQRGWPLSQLWRLWQAQPLAQQKCASYG